MTLILSGTNGVSDIDGDASTPAVRGTDANTGIFFGSDVIGFSEGGTECARFNADAQFVAAAGTASLPVLTTTGDVNTGIYFPAADNIGFATGGTIRGRWTTDGLCFGTDTATANALDDYEEGTFTPTVTGSTSAGTTTYNGQTGYYTKIGRQVFVVIDVAYSAATGTGTMKIGGLPFTAASLTGTAGVGSVMTQGLNWSGGSYLSAYVSFNADYIVLYGSTDDAVLTLQSLTNETVNLWLSASYLAS